MIEMYLLQQLVGLAEYRTLSEAAEHLHITQPTLTRSIHKLEGLLGVELFRREKNRITINEAGQLAVEYARRILASEEEMVTAIHALARSRHTIAIAACAPAPNLILLPELEKRFPHMQASAAILPETELLDALRRGEFQLVILSQPITEEGLFCQKLGTERLRLSVLPAHPAAALDSVCFAELNNGSYLIYKNLGVWETVCRQYMPQARFLVQNGMDEYLEVVSASSLPTFDTDWGTILYGQRANRVSIPIRDEAAQKTFYAVYKTKEREKFEPLLRHLAQTYT